MSPEQENIIKDKLLEYEVPFEEKFWEDFQERAAAKNLHQTGNSNKRLKYLGIVLLLFLSTAFFGLLKDTKSNNQTDLVSIDYTNNPNDLNKESANVVANNSIVSTEDHPALNDKTSKNKQTYISNNTSTDSKYLANNKNDFNPTNDVEQSNLNNRFKTNKANKIANHTNPNLFNHPKTTNPLFSKQQKQTIKEEHKYIEFVDNASVITSKSIDKKTLAMKPHMTHKNRKTIAGKTVDNTVSINVIPFDSEKHKTTQTAEELNSVKHFEFESIAAIGIDPPKIPQAEDELHQTDDVDWVIQKSKNWEVGLSAGIGLNIPIKYSDISRELNPNFKKRPNLTAGAYFRYQLNKKVGIETGFNYKSIDNNFSSRYILQDNVNLVSIDEATIVNRLRTFEIPIGVNVRLSSWLQLSTGVAFSIVKPSDVFTYLEVENPINYPDIENYQHLSKYSNYGIKKFDARVYAGLTFNVSPYLGFRMVVNQGLLDRTNNDYYSTNHYNVHTDYTFSTIFRFNPKVIK